MNNRVNLEWKSLLRACLNGQEQSPRGMRTKEVIAHQSMIPMTDPRVTHPTRKISNRFRYAEAAWILSGDNRVSTISPFNKNIAPFADDGHRYFGAYGPKVVDQLAYCAQKLVQDHDSRQAVINIWRENPPLTKDVPCTLSLQFLIRQGALWTVATMRSSDAWLGWPYDVFNFSMVARALCIYIKSLSGLSLGLGNLVLTAGSQHLYEKHWKVAEEISLDYAPEQDTELPLKEDICGYESVDAFVATLWGLAHASL